MESIWMKDYIDSSLPSINKDITAPILIIGGGLAGLMCAYNLMKNGIKFILVDSKNIARGVSAYTTAQVSIAQDLIYNEIIKKHGKNKAKMYLKSQIEGLNLIKNIILKEKINCDYKEESSVLYSNKKSNIKNLINQYNLIKKYNETNILTKNKDFIKFKKAVEFKNQIILNPMKFMIGILNILIKNKITMYENSKVTKIIKNKNNYKVIINDKFKIKTDKIIMACHYPILNPDNLYFVKIYQSKSYVVAFETNKKLNSNYISIDYPYYYIRSYDNSTLMIGGHDHFTGIKVSPKECYEDLINKIYELDKNAKIKYKWFTEDCMTLDSLPFIGKYSYKNPNIFLVTGFQKWGFTNSAIAAKNITNIITNKKIKNIYNFNRTILIKNLKSTFRMLCHSINGLIISKIFVKKYKLNEINIDSGKVMRYRENNVLVYRESKNKYIILKNKCTHMGCSLIWNDEDKIWESKCHGSIFDRYGHVIYGPAIKDLEKLNF